MAARGVDQPNGVLRDGLVDVDGAHLPLQRGEGGDIGDGPQLLERHTVELATDDPHLVGLRGVADRNLHEEPVELGLGQRVDALLLDGVLRRDDEERRGKGVGDAVHGDLPLLHGLEQRRLGARRGAVQFVAQQDVREHGAGAELERTVPLVEDGDAGDVGGEEVRRELDALEARVHRLRERPGEERLAKPGHVLDQDVAAGQQRGEDEVDGAVLAHDNAGDVVAQGARNVGPAGHVCSVAVCRVNIARCAAVVARLKGLRRGANGHTAVLRCCLGASVSRQRDAECFTREQT